MAVLVAGGGGARWYVNAAGQVLRVGPDGDAALVDVGRWAKEGAWPDEPTTDGGGDGPHTVPFAVAPGGVPPPPAGAGAEGAGSAAPYAGAGLVVDLGQHHGATFYHVFTELLPQRVAAADGLPGSDAAAPVFGYEAVHGDGARRRRPSRARAGNGQLAPGHGHRGAAARAAGAPGGRYPPCAAAAVVPRRCCRPTGCAAAATAAACFLPVGRRPRA